MRVRTLGRQKELGIVPPDIELPAINPIGTAETRTGPDGLPFPELDITRPWDSLSDDEKKLFSRMAEVYAAWGHFDDGEWELYNIDADRAELHNLAAEMPDKLQQLVNLWLAEAGANGAFPLDDRLPLEILLTPRQLLSPGPRTIRLPPRHRRSPREPGGQRPQAILRDRRAPRHPSANRGGSGVRPRIAFWRPRAPRQRTTGSTTSTPSSAWTNSESSRPRIFRPEKT
jgi:hypothetical protein